jgi:hypothetical protein
MFHCGPRGAVLAACAALAAPLIFAACQGAGGPEPAKGEGIAEPFPGAYQPLGAPGQRIVHLWYADGSPGPARDPLCAGRSPPPYTCSFAASPGACAAAVQVHLAPWYQAFNVHFTLVSPGKVPHDTVTITSNGDWCGGVPAGLAPVTCEALTQGDAWAFLCGDSAQQCAAIIAQEQAHLLGLQHTDSAEDLMFNPVCTSCRGFDDRDNLVVGSRCRRVQNSFQLVKERLGAADH